MGVKIFFWKIALCVFLIFLNSVFFVEACEEGDIKSCGFSDIGECSKGVQTCSGGGWTICFGEQGPVPEVCDDGLDNNCDGEVDEGCECNAGETRECIPGGYSLVGICNAGEEICESYGEWSGQCLNYTAPSNLDLCGAGVGNGLDDDCDGEVDEGCRTPSLPGVPGTCNNRIKDGDETGIDCGGPCDECPDCSNGQKEKDEIRVNVVFENDSIGDCGGLNCPKCPTCRDSLQNQGEEGVDCGGPCTKSCEGDGDGDNNDEDNDGLSKSVELEKGTNPKNPDTDYDGVMDGQDLMPLCPNKVCDVNFGENENNCAEDCKPERSSFLIVVAILLFLVVAIGLFFYFQFRSTSDRLGQKSTGAPGWGNLSSSGAGRGRRDSFGGESGIVVGGVGENYRRRSSGLKRKRKQKESAVEKRLRESVERAGKLRRKK